MSEWLLKDTWKIFFIIRDIRTFFKKEVLGSEWIQQIFENEYKSKIKEF